MKHRLINVLIVLGLMVAVAGCAAPTQAPEPTQAQATQAPQQATEPPTQPSPTEAQQSTTPAINAGMVTTVGGLGDKGFNDLAWAGLTQAKDELGAEIKVLEPTSPSEYVTDLSQLAENDYLAFGVGYLFFDSVTEVAAKYPDKHFAIIDSVVEAPNVASITFREEQGSFLAGVLAAYMTKLDTPYTKADKKTVGFLGAMRIPIIEKFEAGFVAGVKYVDPAIEVLIEYAGNDPSTAWTNPTAGYELSVAMNDKGADVIYHAAGSTGAGLFKAAKERSFFAIGVDMDQGPMFPDSPILTSMVKRVDFATFTVVKMESEGQFPAKQIIFGIPEGGIVLAPFGDYDQYVPQNVKDALQAAQEDVVSGKIQVPEVPEAK
ncbi:MAG: BMP family lipoprotein [Anaerolineaceae bacterium]